MRFFRLTAIFGICIILAFLLSSCLNKDQGNTPRQGLKIVCLGDSITYGYKLADPAVESYPALLSRKAQGRWQVLNCGLNGATVLVQGDLPVMKQAPYQRAVSSAPDVVVVLLGTNDTKKDNWQHIKDFESDFVRLVNKLQGLPSHPRVIVCSVPPVFSDYPNGITAAHIKRINLLVKRVVGTVGSEYLDVYAAMSTQPSLFTDGVHPNVKGAEALADLVYKRILTQ